MRMGTYVLAGLLALAGSVGAQVSKNLVERLHQAEIEDSIDGPEMKPWHLKLSFQTFDPKGTQTDQGTIDEWWDGGKHRIVVKSAGYNATELKNDTGRFLTVDADSMPHYVKALVQGVVHPMPKASEVDRVKPDLTKQTIATVPMECIMLTEEVGLKMESAPAGMFPTYCLLKDTNRMVISYDPGAEMLQISTVGKFAGHTIGTSITLVDRGFVVAKAHVDALSGSAADVGDFSTMAGLGDVIPPVMHVPMSVMVAKVVKRPDPVYPASAKQAHKDGKVILQAIVGRDGRIRQLRVQSAPDGALAMSALDAVRQWVFSPYVLNGRPLEVETTITVNYTFG